MILADLSEPQEIVKLINQAVECQHDNLNQIHLSDYFFAGPAGTFQVSRKQAGEILSNLDEAEDQLRDYLPNADHNCQLVEGIISTVPIAKLPVRVFGESDEPSIRGMTAGGLYSYRVEINGYVQPGVYYPHIQAPMWFAWIHRLAEAGVPTYRTLTWAETAKLLVAVYQNEQKNPEEHSTLHRIIKPKIYLREAAPFVKALVFLSQALRLGVGEDKAHAIAGKYGSIRELLEATPKELQEIPGIGKKISEKILKSLGKEL